MEEWQRKREWIVMHTELDRGKEIITKNRTGRIIDSRFNVTPMQLIGRTIVSSTVVVFHFNNATLDSSGRS